MRSGRKYVYCIVEGGKTRTFGNIGLDGERVRSIPCGKISAVIHDYSTRARKRDKESLKRILRHQEVIDMVSRHFDSVLPMSYNVVVRDEKALKGWLKREQPRLKAKLEELRGKVELGVQVFWDMELMREKVMEDRKYTTEVSEDANRIGEGVAYLNRVRIGEAVRRELTSLAEKYCSDFYERLKRSACMVKTEKIKRTVGKHMLMNVSLLVEKDKVKEVGKELSRIKKMEGLDVRFTGPWPPYSFV